MRSKRLSQIFEGFTFVELLIVTTIIVVLTSIAIPQLRSSYENFKLHNITQRFIKLFYAGRELSMLENRLYKISISDQIPFFVLMVETMMDHQNFQILSGGIGQKQYLPMGYHIQFDYDEILFKPDGSTTPCDIKIVNTIGQSNELQIITDGKIIEKSKI